jgi:hypothetical protein
VPAIVRNNLRLYHGRWLSNQRYYEESLEQLQQVQPEQVADPATLLFCRGVAHHHLMHKTLGLAALDRLMDDVAEAPTRYRAMAMLLHHDLSQLENESLDAVARQMQDIERRLELGRTGKKVIKIEEDVIAALDRMIKQLEDPGEGPHCPNCPAPPGPGPAPPGPPNPRKVVREPRTPGGGSARGEGEVNPKKFAAEKPWGDLDPKEREKALQQIGRDFPSHYGQVIEDYFRKIAGEGDRK